MPTLTLTRPGDTWASIAQEHFGYNYSGQDLQDLLCANGPSLYYWPQRYQLQNLQQHNVYCPLPEYRAIWLPKSCRTLTTHDETLLRRLDSMPLVARQNLTQLEAAGISPNYAVAATQMAQKVRERNASNSNELSKIQKLQLAMGMAFADQAGDYFKGDIDEIIEKMRTLNNALRRNASSGLLSDEVQAAYNDVSAALSRGTLKLANRFTGFKLDTQENLMKAARNARYFRRWRGFSVMSLEGMENIKDMGRFLSVMNPWGMMAIEVILGFMNVTDAYENNRNWKEEGIGEIGMIGGSFVGGKYFWPSIKKPVLKLIQRAIPSLVKAGAGEEGLTVLGVAEAGGALGVGGIAALATAEFWVPVLIGGAIAVGTGYGLAYLGKEIYKAI